MYSKIGSIAGIGKGAFTYYVSKILMILDPPLASPSVRNLTLGHTVKITVASAFGNPPSPLGCLRVICDRSIMNLMLHRYSVYFTSFTTLSVYIMLTISIMTYLHT